jgi:myo-inositol-1-phosphate synthase
MGEVRVAIIGVGNCASALVQGIEFYKDHPEGYKIPGLMHTTMGGYSIKDIKIVAAFDVAATKVGRKLGDAIFAFPNRCVQFDELSVHNDDVVVMRGMTFDGMDKLKEIVDIAPGETEPVAELLKYQKVDVVVNFLPVGSEMATKWYVEQAIEAGCAFVNGMPVFIASSEHWAKEFARAGLPVIGDDIKSQVGATIVHRVLAKLFEDRGVKIDRTYQLNFGGNMDFYNMLDQTRLESKKISKTQSVQSQIAEGLHPDKIHISPSDYVRWLEDRKMAFIRLEGKAFGNVPLELELKLTVEDSPNSAGVIIDAVRCAKIALDRGLSGAIVAPSSYFMKSPPVQFSDSEAHDLVEEFING